jgi:hypothetical protein
MYFVHYEISPQRLCGGAMLCRDFVRKAEFLAVPVILNSDMCDFTEN